MKSKQIVPVIIVVLIVAAIAIVLMKNKKAVNEKAAAVPQGVSATPVKIVSVEQKSVDNGIQLTGSFEARQTLPLIAEAQGSITELNIKEGQRIGAGQVIARIDPTSLLSNLATAQATYNNAVKNMDRYQRLVAAGAISQKQYEDVSLNVESARANVNSIKQQMKYTIVRSPMSGIVGNVKVERGSFATLGMQLGNIVDVSKLKMVLKVSESDVIKLKTGLPVAIKTEVYPDQVFNGNITLISVQADVARKYNVVIEVPNNNSFPLKAGMFGTATLSTQNTEKGVQLFLPRQAIVGSIQDAKVFVLSADSSVTLRSIEVQNQSGDQLTVLKGLNAGEKVIISGQINLQNGNKVRVVGN